MTKTNQQILNAEVTHAELQASIIQLATLKGYEHFHNLHPEGSDPGWPDLVLCKPPRLIFLELKTERGKLTEAQRGWLLRLKACNQECYLLRPTDWSGGFIERLFV